MEERSGCHIVPTHCTPARPSEPFVPLLCPPYSLFFFFYPCSQSVSPSISPTHTLLLRPNPFLLPPLYRTFTPSFLSPPLSSSPLSSPSPLDPQSEKHVRRFPLRLPRHRGPPRRWSYRLWGVGQELLTPESILKNILNHLKRNL